MYPGTVNCEKYKIPQFCFQICLHFDPLSLLLNIARRNDLSHCDKYPLPLGRPNRSTFCIFHSSNYTPFFVPDSTTLGRRLVSSPTPTAPVPVIALADLPRIQSAAADTDR